MDELNKLCSELESSNFESTSQLDTLKLEMQQLQDTNTNLLEALDEGRDKVQSRNQLQFLTDVSCIYKSNHGLCFLNLPTTTHEVRIHLNDMILCSELSSY